MMMSQGIFDPDLVFTAAAVIVRSPVGGMFLPDPQRCSKSIELGKWFKISDVSGIERCCQSLVVRWGGESHGQALAQRRQAAFNWARSIGVEEDDLRSAVMDEKKAAILQEIPRLRRYARALLRDRDSADDLVQDSLERALSRLDNWRSGESPRRWLFTIMHHLFIDQMRKVSRRGEAAILPLEASEALATPAIQAESVASREIVDALQQISPDRRAALVMVAIEGFSYAEAATMLGVPAGTLMSRIARGREELRGLLDDQARRRAIRIVEK
nr:sigma-70 family RNA polymerase sigma factor [Aminobacter aminovorans]